MSKTAVVARANQSLRLALAKGLANRLNPDNIVYLTARSEERGRAALQGLGETRARVAFAHLDVTDDNSMGSNLCNKTDRQSQPHNSDQVCAANRPRQSRLDGTRRPRVYLYCDLERRSGPSAIDPYIGRDLECCSLSVPR